MWLKSVAQQLIVAALLGTSSALAEPSSKYKKFEDAMQAWGYGWEPMTVTTEDGYVLTVFHITEKFGAPEIARDPTLMPVVLMHGYGGDAVSWVYTPPAEQSIEPLPLHLFDDGFDVFLAANRGTQYCQEHLTLDWTQPEYWAWSFVEFGLYDDTAVVQAIQEFTSKPKVSYVGYSNGNLQMNYALATAEKEYLGSALYTFAALAPCTIVQSAAPEVYTDGVFHWQEFGIYAINGPNWKADVKTICDNFPDYVCQYAHSLTGYAPISVQFTMHTAQNTIEDRFQEFAPNYNIGEHITPLIPLDHISIVPITMWSGDQDTTCYQWRALETAETIGDSVTEFVKVPNATHSGPLRAPYYEELRARLIDPTKQDNVPTIVSVQDLMAAINTVQ